MTCFLQLCPPSYLSLLCTVAERHVIQKYIASGKDIYEITSDTSYSFETLNMR